MVAVGVLLALFVDTQKVGVGLTMVLSGFIATLGGALLTIAFTAEDSDKEKILSALKPTLDSLARDLASLKKNIDGITAESLADRVDSKHALWTIKILSHQLLRSMTDITRIKGEKVDTASHRTTAESYDELAEVDASMEGIQKDIRADLQQLASDKAIKRPEEKSEIIKRVMEKVESIKEKRIESVSCPYCGGQNEVNLGPDHGDSGMANCTKCTKRFHIHRDGNGEPFTRVWGFYGRVNGPGESAVIDVTCTLCQFKFEANYPIGEDMVVRFCLNCGTKLKVNQKGMVLHHESRPLVRTVSFSNAGFRSVLFCAEHNRSAVSFAKTDGRIFSVCDVGDHLVYIDETDVPQ